MHVFWHTKFDTGMPARTIEDEHDLLGWTGTYLARELGQLDLEHGDTDRRGQMEERAPGGGMDEADEIAPGEAVLYRGNWTLTNRRPDLAQQWLEADAVFVGRPQFDVGLGEGRRDCLEQWS